MGTKRNCEDCKRDISNLSHWAKRCKECQIKHREEYKKEHAKEYWQKNKDRYESRHNNELGNPKQDDEILEFLRKKRKA